MRGEMHDAANRMYEKILVQKAVTRKRVDGELMLFYFILLLEKCMPT